VTARRARARAGQVVRELKSLADPSQLHGMARFGINTRNALGGIGLPQLRGLAKQFGRDHDLALALWDTGLLEARLLAGMLDEPEKVTEEQMEVWAAGFESWDLVDGVCGDLFDKTPFAYRKAVEWCGRDEEFVKRAGFAMIARMAVHDKEAPDRVFGAFLPLIEREAGDRRNFVRKAVNWALREIGKRSRALNAIAVDTALRIQEGGPRSGRWVASDALRELRSDGVQGRLEARAASRLRPSRARPSVRARRPPPEPPS
jgi:3-methyladenine DNA glycosylase AlkD